MKHWSKPSSPLGPLLITFRWKQDPEREVTCQQCKQFEAEPQLKAKFPNTLFNLHLAPKTWKNGRNRRASPTAVLMMLSPRLYFSFNSPPSVFCPDCQASPACSRVMQKAVPGSCNSTSVHSDRFSWQILFTSSKESHSGSEHALKTSLDRALKKCSMSSHE